MACQVIRALSLHILGSLKYEAKSSCPNFFEIIDDNSKFLMNRNIRAHINICIVVLNIPLNIVTLNQIKSIVMDVLRCCRYLVSANKSTWYDKTSEMNFEASKVHVMFLCERPSATYRLYVNLWNCIYFSHNLISQIVN